MLGDIDMDASSGSIDIPTKVPVGYATDMTVAYELKDKE
ncbi:hypothetical protein KIPB_006703, partial [Kipferlia bialata]|eukprot:g6703.t1